MKFPIVVAIHLLLVVAAVFPSGRKKGKKYPSDWKKVYHVSVNRKVMWPNQILPTHFDSADVFRKNHSGAKVHTGDFFALKTSTRIINPTKPTIGRFQTVSVDEPMNNIMDDFGGYTYQNKDLSLEPSIDSAVEYYDKPAAEYFYYEPNGQLKSAAKPVFKFLFFLPLIYAYYQFAFYLLSTPAVVTVTSTQTSVVSLQFDPNAMEASMARYFAPPRPAVSTTTAISTLSVFTTSFSTIRDVLTVNFVSFKTEISISPTTATAISTLKTTETNRLFFTVTSMATSTVTLPPSTVIMSDYHALDASGDEDEDYYYPALDENESYEDWIGASGR